MKTFETSLNFTVFDTTVSVTSAVVRIGNRVMDFRGGNIDFSRMVSFSGSGPQYQRSVLVLQDVGREADMTAIVSAPAATIRDLEYPVLPTDSMNPYSPVYPIGSFIFWTDGETISLVSSSRVS